MSSEVVWEDVTTGSVSIGDTVRVKANSYKNLVGDMHNGRICEVIGICSGDVVVKSIDGMLPLLTKTYHAPYVLEKKVDHESIS